MDIKHRLAATLLLGLLPASWTQAAAFVQQAEGRTILQAVGMAPCTRGAAGASTGGS